jgi:hypothetical protein
MTITWTGLFPDEALLLGRVWYKDPGAYSLVVPSSFSLYPSVTPAYVRAMCVGSGGQGDHWGGGSAYARAVSAVAVGEALSIQCGDVGTASMMNDSFVKHANGAVIVYADRGRGAGVRGVAANSTGDVTRDGQPGGANFGGPCGSDAGDYARGGFGGVGSDYNHTIPADFGCGGHILGYVNEYGIDQGHVAWTSGTGLVCLEFFDGKPGY